MVQQRPQRPVFRSPEQPSSPRSGGRAAPGRQRPAGRPDGWQQLAGELDEIARRLEALAARSPSGEPDARVEKALLSAVGRIGQHTGVLKRLLGIGTKKASG